MRPTLRLLKSSTKLTSSSTSSTSSCSSSFPWLQSLKIKQLQHLAQKTGLPSSGTKAVLVSSLESGLARYQRDSHGRVASGSGPGLGSGAGVGSGLAGEKEKEKGENEEKRKILSIDMGIRNLAFAVLGVSGPGTAAVQGGGGGLGSLLEMGKGKGDEKEKEKSGRAPSTRLELSLDAWRRVSLPLDRGVTVEEFARYLDSSSPGSDFGSGVGFGTGSDSDFLVGAEAGVESLDADVDTSSSSSPAAAGKGKKAQALSKGKDKDKDKQKIPFSLPIYATHAHSVITALLARYNPTHVLIERQRFRSGGGSAVQEWSLRVGVFEGMLWAVLHSLQQQQQKQTGSSPSVIAIEPARVGRFLALHSSISSSGSTGVQTKTSSREGKKLKIDLVGSWLENEAFLIHDSGGVQEWMDGYMAKWKKSSKLNSKSKSKSKSEDGGAVVADIGKLDDLADCLVQGVTWLEWERMKRRVVREGLEGVVVGVDVHS
ncbi:mitochondrial resolvase Ydc2 [Aspergillus varians]